MSFLTKLFGPKRFEIKEEELTWKRFSPPPSDATRKVSSGQATGQATGQSSSRGMYSSEITGMSPTKFPASPGPYNVFAGEAASQLSKPLKPNSSNFFRYRAEHLKQQQTTSPYTDQGMAGYDPMAKQEAYYERPSHESFQPAVEAFPYQQTSSQSIPVNYQRTPMTSSTQLFPAGSFPSGYQTNPEDGWMSDRRSHNRSPENHPSTSNGYDYQTQDVHRPVYENIVDIEKRVSLRMLGNEEVISTPRTRTDIFGDQPSKPSPANHSSLFLSRQSLPSVNSINAITARPEASMRKLHIFEKLATEENEKKAAQRGGKPVAGKAGELRTEERNVQVIKPASLRKQETEIQDFGVLMDENKRLSEELHRLEVEHGQLSKDPRNMNVQETNFRILLEASMAEDRKKDVLRKDVKALDGEIANKQAELSILRSLQGNQRGNLANLPDFKDRERILNEIDKTRSEIETKRVNIDNQRMNEIGKAARLREVSERQMAMELEGHAITINNSNEALLKELLHFQKELL